MLGNVWEVCADQYLSYRQSPPKDERARGNPDTKWLTKRGGGFLYGGPAMSRSSQRGGAARDDSTWALGYRITRSLVIHNTPSGAP